MWNMKKKKRNTLLPKMSLSPLSIAVVVVVAKSLTMQSFFLVNIKIHCTYWWVDIDSRAILMCPWERQQEIECARNSDNAYYLWHCSAMKLFTLFIWGFYTCFSARILFRYNVYIFFFHFVAIILNWRIPSTCV